MESSTTPVITFGGLISRAFFFPDDQFHIRNVVQIVGNIRSIEIVFQVTYDLWLVSA